MCALRRLVTHSGQARIQRLRGAMKRACCSPDALASLMSAANELEDYDCPPPEGFAVWSVLPSAYDPKAPSSGGVIYPCLPSPPMLSIDREGHCWVAQDQASSVMRIDAKSGACEQLSLPMPGSNETLRIAGPSVGRAPDGAIWFTLLGHHAALVRVDPVTRASLPASSACRIPRSGLDDLRALACSLRQL